MSFLSPSSVTVIGASHQPGKVGHDIFKNLTQGFQGTLYPVNPKGGALLGHPCLTSIADLPQGVDLAIIVIPAAAVPQALRECHGKGIRRAVIISAGFGEVGTEEGKELEEEIRAIGKETAMQIIGPNCLGILRPSASMNASFAKELPPAGNVGLISQSGATAVAVMDAAPELGIGFSGVFSIGNKTVLDECDLLELLRDDPETTVIGCYLESIKDGQRFRTIAAEIAKTKPIVLLKVGVSSQGQRAVSSHTGALAGSDKAIDAVCAQSGIRRAHSLEEFLDALIVLGMQPPLPSNQIAVVTNAGGPGILATDATEIHGLALPSLTEKGAVDLKKLLPPAASVKNPIDVLGDADAARYEAALTAAANDPGIDGIVVLLTPQVMTPVAAIADAIIAMKHARPLLPVTVSFVGGVSIREGIAVLHAANIPCFATPERAIRAMATLRPKLPRPSLSVPVNGTMLPQGKEGLLSEEDTRALFAAFDLPLPRQALAKTREEAIRYAADMGTVVAKISAPEILHKTDVGGVKIGLSTPEDVGQAFDEILNNVQKNVPHATVQGILIQEQMPPGAEFIVGGLQDPSFGPMIMVGLGGIYAELFKDTSFRLAPVSLKDAYDMLDDLQSWKLLLGMRGKPQADIDALAALVSKVSALIAACPDIAELDINPAIVRPDGIVIADAKVVVRRAQKSH